MKRSLVLSLTIALFSFVACGNKASTANAGDKATDTLMLSMPETAEKPQIGHSSKVRFADRNLTLYRMPSSSRAYPLALDKKAEAYKNLFKEIGLL